MMDFEWDEAKNRSNLAKHGISFEEAREIFDGPMLRWEDSRREYGETRYISVGIVGGSPGLVLVVAHTLRGRKFRIISVRKANVGERKRYHAYFEEKS
jgi:uncharacterized DUF497 family protein